MENDKNIELLIDAKEERTSECCDAQVIDGRCYDCKENV